MPPENVTVMLPNPVLQSGSVFVDEDVTAVGMVTVLVWSGPAQPLLSFTLTVCDPALKLPKIAGDVQAA